MKIAIRDLQTLFDVGTVGSLSNGQLLDRFLARRDEADFAVLVERLGPMVWGVCRRVLRDHHDAEDAFQAAFLVLARKADSVRPREKVGHWLYGVAYQTARKARANRLKRRMRERPSTDCPEPEAKTQRPQTDLLDHLDHELSRLPEKYRLPILLCELEGQTHQQAAARLGWPVGTVSGRLSRARTLLAKRLSACGASLSSGSLAALLAQQAPTSAGMPAHLILSTAHAASMTAAGQTLSAGLVSAGAVTLSNGALKTMLLTKLKTASFVSITGLALVAGGTGLGYWMQDTGEKPAGAVHASQAVPHRPQPHEDAGGVDRQDSEPALLGASVFGGGPDEPLYLRDGNFVYVSAPHGEWFAIYDAATEKASKVRLPGTKESPIDVTPIMGGPGLIVLDLKGPKFTKVYAFNVEDSKWYIQDLKEPASGSLSPILSRSVAVYKQGRDFYAFSTKANDKGWGVCELPADAPDNVSPIVGMDSVTIEYDGHVYEFSALTGEWKHYDFRALIDAAIDAAEEEAK